MKKEFYAVDYAIALFGKELKNPENKELFEKKSSFLYMKLGR